MSKTTITKKLIAELKAKHHAIYEVNVGDKTAIVAFPNWSTWRQAVTALQKGSATAFAEAILNNGLLAGDNDIATTDDHFLSLKEQFDEIIEFGDAVVTRESNTYVINIEGKEFKCKPITREIVNLAERSNSDQKPFVTAENILRRVLIEGDKEVLSTKNPYFYVPLLAEMEKLYDKKIVSIKKL